MAIYSRDNFAPALQSALDSALRRRDEYVKRDAARRDANVKAITDFMEGVAYAADDDLDEREKKLLAEKAAAQKAQNDANKAVLDANERSLNASQAMQDYRPNSALAEQAKESFALQNSMARNYEPTGSPTDMNQYEEALKMAGYHPLPWRLHSKWSAQNMRGYHPEVLPQAATGNRSQYNPDFGKIPNFYRDGAFVQIPQDYLDAMLNRGEGVY